MCGSGSPNPHHDMMKIGGIWENKGQQTPFDADVIRRTMPDSHNEALGWGSVAPPQAPDISDQTLKSAKQGQILNQLAMAGYQATFLGAH